MGAGMPSRMLEPNTYVNVYVASRKVVVRQNSYWDHENRHREDTVYEVVHGTYHIYGRKVTQPGDERNGGTYASSAELIAVVDERSDKQAFTHAEMRKDPVSNGYYLLLTLTNGKIIRLELDNVGSSSTESSIWLEHSYDESRELIKDLARREGLEVDVISTGGGAARSVHERMIRAWEDNKRRPHQGRVVNPLTGRWITMHGPTFDRIEAEVRRYWSEHPKTTL
jgi:hypothetical protein